MNSLKWLRSTMGLSQRAVAERLGIHPGTYCRVERGWYGRPPAGFEQHVLDVFGPHWSWRSLMETAPPPRKPRRGSQ